MASRYVIKKLVAFSMLMLDSQAFSIYFELSLVCSDPITIQGERSRIRLKAREGITQVMHHKNW